MPQAFTKRTAGEPLTVFSNEYNAFIDAAIDHRSRIGRATPGARRPLGPGEVLIRNDTGSAVDEFRALALSESLFTAAQSGFDDPAFIGLTPNPETTPAHRSRIAITLEPLASGAIGRGMIGGQLAMPVDVIATAHTRARVVADGSLQSGYIGPVRILAAPAAGTTARCRVSIDHDDGGNLWIAIPEAGIAAGTFAAPSTATCVVAWPDPSTGAVTPVPSDRTYRTVTATHYGPAIEHTAGKYVQARVIGGRIVPDVEYC